MSRAGCCTGCRGTGYSGDQAVPGGKCWDCLGTGHPHDGRCTPWWTPTRLAGLAAMLLFVLGTALVALGVNLFVPLVIELAALAVLVVARVAEGRDAR